MKKLNQNLSKLKLSAEAKLKDVARSLESSGMKIVLITDQANRLIGTVTDGDIRRGIIEGLNLESSIDTVMNLKPLAVKANIDRMTIKKLMIKNKVQQIPIVDENRSIIGLHSWDEVDSPSPHSNIFMVMAGGRGTRLQPHTNNCPKPLLPINGKPILEHIIEGAKNDGFQNFILAINYLGEMIEEYFGDGREFGVNIEYINEQSPLGTAGALSMIDPKPDSAFIVTNGDSISGVNYSNMLNFHTENDAKATVAVRMNEWQNPYGVVSTRGIEILDIEEKPVYRSRINVGSYVLDSEAIHLLERDQYCDMPTLLKRVQDNQGRLVAFAIHESWMDFTNPEDLKLNVNSRKGY